MRHLGSAALALVLAPLACVLADVGFFKASRASALYTGKAQFGGLALGVLLLLLAGAMIAALILPRFSPVGPAALAVVLVALSAWGMLAPENMLKTVPIKSIAGVPSPLVAPFIDGLALLLAVPLIATVLFPVRWRGAATAPVTPFGAAPTGYPPYSPSGSPYQPAHVGTVRLNGGQQGLSIDFAAPAPLGLLSGDVP